jgi:hypothetical protein
MAPAIRLSNSQNGSNPPALYQARMLSVEAQQMTRLIVAGCGSLLVAGLVVWGCAVTQFRHACFQ